MGISQFFEDDFDAPLRNTRWSWGAVDSKGRVLIRVWEHEIEPIKGATRVLVLRDPPLRQTHGQNERKEHLRIIEAGAQGFGVICRAADPASTEGHTLASFDASSLLRLGQLLREPGLVYAQVIERIPISEFLTETSGE